MENALIQAIDYDPETGIFTWRTDIGKTIKAGQIAGGLDRRGYWRVGLHGRHFTGARLAWLLTYGCWPSDVMDHRNLNRGDNRWCNLRNATHAQNSQNVHKRRDGYKGVTFHKGVGRFQAQIKCRGHNHYIGLFDSAEAAYSAYLAKSSELHGEFGRAA